MSSFFDWLSKLIGVFVIFGVSVATIYLIAFFEGREISFWPPTIGEKPRRRQEKLIWLPLSYNPRVQAPPSCSTMPQEDC